MARKLHNLLNTVLPMSTRTRLRKAALSTIPSMRHLDMEARLKHLAALGFAPAVIHDIGAASGDWSTMVASIWPAAKLVGFEPNQRERANLDATKARLPQFDYHMCFLGPEVKAVTYSDQDTRTSLYDQEHKGQATASAEMRVLDQLVAAGSVPTPNFMKLDVQGFELEVLAGSTKALATCDLVLLEVSFIAFMPGIPTVEKVVRFMDERGFAWYDVMGILRRSSDDSLLQMDVAFLRKDHTLRRADLPV